MPGPLKRSHKLPKGVRTLAQVAKGRGRGGQIMKQVRIEEGLRGDLGATTRRTDRFMDRPAVSGKMSAGKAVSGEALSGEHSRLAKVESMASAQATVRNQPGRVAAAARSILGRGGRALGIAAPAGIVSTAREYQKFRSRKKTLRQKATEVRGGTGI